MEATEKRSMGTAPAGAVEFVSYDGAYPNLCSGTLVLDIGGECHVFKEGRNREEKASGVHGAFWSPGGSCGFMGGSYDDLYCDTGPWEIDSSSLPEELMPLAEEIGAAFNAHVPFGCCGGCL